MRPFAFRISSTRSMFGLFLCHLYIFASKAEREGSLAADTRIVASLFLVRLIVERISSLPCVSFWCDLSSIFDSFGTAPVFKSSILFWVVETTSKWTRPAWQNARERSASEFIGLRMSPGIRVQSRMPHTMPRLGNRRRMQHAVLRSLDKLMLAGIRTRKITRLFS